MTPAAPAIVLDSGPLGLLFQKAGVKAADRCRQWLRGHVAAGVRVIVPEIVDYELRRELLRIGQSAAVAALDAFNAAAPDRYLPVTTAALRLASDLWSRMRQQGIPTSDRHALDVDVILAAQVLASGLNPPDFVVATTNQVHLSRLVPAELWDSI
jgi:predicted nucleic acid-binding protein